ncbi:MAG: SRPBCC domain-containing protein [Balneolaceae bacterium]|nr:SRPBCC domain-containing protein [Balneolaceae bacterium]
MSEEWTSFTKRIVVKAPMEKLYEAWTTQRELEKWFLRSAENTKPDGTIRDSKESFQTGDTFHWMWHGYPDSVFEKRAILDVNGEDYLKFMFTDTCPVEVKLEDLGDKGVMVELTQSNIPTDEASIKRLFVGCGEGWTFYLANLKSIYEGGVDLRNKDEELAGLINA